ncbi:MAG: hypothetical protein KJ955_05740 [Nanoarchaeota archaeon]|nr:hypothetical protein [Nanoarchaeota archaeon]
MLPKAIPKLKSIYDSKLHHFYRLFHKKKSAMSMKSSLQRLRMSVNRQIRVLKAIEKHLIKKFPALAKNASPALKQVINVLEQEKTILSATKLKKNYDEVLLPVEEKLLNLLHKEIRLLEKLEKSLPGNKAKQKKELKLLKQVNENIRKLRTAIGNKKEVQKAGRMLLKHLARLQHTEMYEFIKSDALKVKKEVKYVMEYPRETRLKQVFAGIYLVAPFTFDATGALVLLRYVIKYSIGKSRKVALTIKASADKRKRHIKVF